MHIKFICTICMSSVYPLSSDMSNVPTTSLSSSEDEGGQNANNPNAGNGMGKLTSCIYS